MIMMLTTALFSAQVFATKDFSFIKLQNNEGIYQVSSETTNINLQSDKKSQSDIKSQAKESQKTHNNKAKSSAATSNNSTSKSESHSDKSENTGNKAGDESDAKPAHSMDNLPDSNGFCTVPWLSVNFIRSSMTRGLSSQQSGRNYNNYKINPYPADKSLLITSRNLRLQSNQDCLMQALDIQVSRLTAG